MNSFRIVVRNNIHGRKVVIKGNQLGPVLGEARRLGTYGKIIRELFA